MKIKICGLSRKEDIECVNVCQPDYIGFVFAKSHRQVTYDQAKRLKQCLDKNIQSVGVFVDEDIDFIVKLVNEHIIDMVQLHGKEDHLYINRLKQQIHCPMIKAINIHNQDDLDKKFDVDYYLLDSRSPGSGKTFDWNLIQKMDKPFFLAGGIDIHNIDEAMKIKSYCIDVSSGVETNKVKDPFKIKEIVRRVKNECR